MAGLVRVNGQTYEFMGHPTQDDIGTKLQAKQVSLKVTPTQSIFTFNAGPIALAVNFFTPIDPTDLKRLSLPASYISVSAWSLDSDTHEVEVYLDISAEWTSGDSNEEVVWEMIEVIGSNTILNADMRLKNQKPFQETDQFEAQWGTVKFFTDTTVTHEINACPTMRSHFVKNGKLDNTIDQKFRKINDNWPGVGYARTMTASPLKDRAPSVAYYGVAHVRRPAIEYTDSQLNQLWEDYFNGDANKMVYYVYEDREDALKRANALDDRVVADAKRVGGDSYVKIVSAALRQAYGAIELMGTVSKPWMMLKEISSNGN
ncbi:unnamed protein product, partial [Oppiella nova]